MKNIISVKGKSKHIEDLHFQHQLWLSEAAFYEDELKIFQNRIKEIASKNTKKEIQEQLRYFKDQFAIENEQLSILNREASVHEQWLSKISKSNSQTANVKLFIDFKDMQSQIEAFRNIYSELKYELFSFLRKWM